jgi:hypothetical protein
MTSNQYGSYILQHQQQQQQQQNGSHQFESVIATSPTQEWLRYAFKRRRSSILGQAALNSSNSAAETAVGSLTSSYGGGGIVGSWRGRKAKKEDMEDIMEFEMEDV